jgi:hypothetical protein
LHRVFIFLCRAAAKVVRAAALSAAGNLFFPYRHSKFFSGEKFIFLRRKIIFS